MVKGIEAEFDVQSTTMSSFIRKGNSIEVGSTNPSCIGEKVVSIVSFAS